MADQIDKVVEVVITRQTSTPSMASFSEHLVVDQFDASGLKDVFDKEHRVKAYGSLSEVADAGFASTSYVYRAAAKQNSQSPHIKTIYVGWKAEDEDWTTALSEIQKQNNDFYAVSCSCRDMASQQQVAQWVQSAEKLCILATGDKNVVDATTGDIGDWVKTQGLDRVAVFYHPDCEPVETTENKEVTKTEETTHVVYKKVEDGVETWYEDEEFTTPATIPVGVTPELVEGDKYQYVTETTTVVTEEVTVYSLNENDPIPEACWFGKMLTKQPGSVTWALKTLQSLGVYDLQGGQVTNCRNKNVNTYLSAAGISITQEGVTGGEYIDVIHGCDWLKARIQNLVFGVLANNDKVPYTDSGVQMIVSPLRQALDEAVKYEILASYDVEYPAVADIAATEKGKRFLPNVTFTGVLAGAIQSTRIEGTVTL